MISSAPIFAEETNDLKKEAIAAALKHTAEKNGKQQKTEYHYYDIDSEEGAATITIEGVTDSKQRYLE